MNGESYRLRKVTATENKVEKYIHLWGTPSSGIRIQYTKDVFEGTNISFSFEIISVKYIIICPFTILSIYMKQNIISRNSNLSWGLKKFGHCIRRWRLNLSLIKTILPEWLIIGHFVYWVPIWWSGILHIYDVWNHVMRIAIYLVVRKFYLSGPFGC